MTEKNYLNFAAEAADDRPGFFLYVFSQKTFNVRTPRYIKVFYIDN